MRTPADDIRVRKSGSYALHPTETPREDPRICPYLGTERGHRATIGLEAVNHRTRGDGAWRGLFWDEVAKGPAMAR